MRFALLTVFVSILIGAQAGPKTEEVPPLKLQAGDVIRIYTTTRLAEGSGISVQPATTSQLDTADGFSRPSSSAGNDPYTGEFLVQTDGAVYGIGFGRLVVAGHTLSETQRLVRTGMHRLIRESEVFVTLGLQREQHVFIVGGGAGSGTMRLF